MKETSKVSVSVVMPCLNEERSVGKCVKDALIGIKSTGLAGEVIVVDNGSTDKSAKIAKSAGAKVVSEKRRGYGQAYKTGFKEAKGKILVMGDSDGTYDFKSLNKLTAVLGKEADFVIGSRLSGNIHQGSMPWAHRYIGTPILSGMLTLLFGVRVKDSQSGFRAFKKTALQKINPKSTGMEFASELLVGALRDRLKVREVPIEYYPRIGVSKLSSVRDAWRHIRFMLLYSPNALFLIPGLVMLVVGSTIMAVLLNGSIFVNGREYGIHLYTVGFLLVIISFQIISLGIYAKTYAIQRGLEYQNKFVSFFYRYFSLERGLVMGLLMSILGAIVCAALVLNWANSGFGALNNVRQILLGGALILVGIQIVFTSFFISLINLDLDE